MLLSGVATSRQRRPMRTRRRFGSIWRINWKGDGRPCGHHPIRRRRDNSIPDLIENGGEASVGLHARELCFRTKRFLKNLLGWSSPSAASFTSRAWSTTRCRPHDQRRPDRADQFDAQARNRGLYVGEPACRGEGWIAVPLLRQRNLFSRWERWRSNWRDSAYSRINLWTSVR
jgi:hypothetical protein